MNANTVPGVMVCAKCDFRVVRKVLYLQDGSVGAGDNKTEPCPNGCGPLWPVTWEQEARDGWKTCERLFDEKRNAEAELAAWKEAMRRARIERERHAGPGGVLNWIEGEVANILAANA